MKITKLIFALSILMIFATINVFISCKQDHNGHKILNIHYADDYHLSIGELWVSDAGNEKVSYFTFDGSKWTLQGNITNGSDAHAMAFTVDSKYAFVSNQGANTVSIVDVSNQS